MKTLVYILLCLFPFCAVAQPIEATLIGHWDDPDIVEAFFDNPYHDVWGAVVDGVEYGIISSTDGFHFFNLSGDGSNMEPVAYVAGTAQGAGIAHRDIKVYQNYLYAVADEGPSALQVFDMSVLPEDPVLVYESDEFLVRSHNIFIDEDNGVLYAAGGNGFNLKVLSLEDPENPSLLATFPNPSFPNMPYIHDLYVKDNIGYLNAAFDGLIVADFSDPTNIQLLGTLSTYEQQGYNHSGWMAESGDHYFMCDETHGTDIKVVDITDLEDMGVIATMNAGSTPNQIVHNVIVQGDLLYASYYYDGLQVFDISNPQFPRRVAYYDTSEVPNDTYFAGAWGVFVMPSGKALISDMNNGFYFFEALDLPMDMSLTPSNPTLEGCLAVPVELDVLVGSDFANTVSVSLEGTSSELEVELETTELEPGEVLSLSITPTVSGTGFTLVLNATDGTNSTVLEVPVQVAVFPEATNLLAPTDGRENVNLTPLFFWQNSDIGALSNRLELSTSDTDFDANIFHTEAVGGNSLILDFELEEGTTYFWRLVSAYPCGDNPSTIFSFTTKMSTAITEIEGNTFELFPNPATEQLNLNFAQGLNEALFVELRSLRGQKLTRNQYPTGATNLAIDISDLPSGIYILQLNTANTTVARKIVVE